MHRLLLKPEIGEQSSGKDDKPSEHQNRGRRARCVNGLKGKGSHTILVFSQTPVMIVTITVLVLVL
eukprot:3227770-Heterocapsa_arctica.AAC.1